MPVADNLKRVTSELPEGVRLVAVSKFHPAEAVVEAYGAGQRIFGESRADELTASAPPVPTTSNGTSSAISRAIRSAALSRLPTLSRASTPSGCCAVSTTLPRASAAA